MLKQAFRVGTVLCAGMIASVIAGLFMLEQRRSDALVEIESAHSELELALATLSVRMAGMATALEREPSLTPAHFADVYGRATLPSSLVPERALALMPEVATPDQLADLVQDLASDYAQAGYPAFELFPTAESETLFPAMLVEPAASRPNVFGYNMAASPERLRAARNALEQGVMTTSAPVSLSQDADSSRASFLLLYPVYLPQLDPATGVTHAVLGAGMTPADLFADNVILFNQHVLDIEIGIAGVPLSVRLAKPDDAGALRLALVRDMEMPIIRTSGFDVPFRATVFYFPTAVDAAWIAMAAFLAALTSILALRALTARETAQEALQAALAQKEAELREAYRIQGRSQRIEALGRLVAGVAHDFNNILTVILGNIELMKEENWNRADAPYIDEAEKATLRGAHLTQQLLSVGRKSHLEPQRLSLADSLHESASMLNRVLPESIGLTVVPAAGLWTVEIDPDSFQNAMLNLALNARDAMDGQGKLTIEAGNTRITPDYIAERQEEEMAPGRYVVVSVSDTGAGMSNAVIDRAFEPFYTTKHTTDGSGLGLASVHGFCRQSGGSCRIYSELGVGTTVRMYFPAVEDNATARSVHEHASTVTSSLGGARILLAEDEDGVARVIVRHLEVAGYRVRRVSTGDAAWELLQNDEPFDLLITDLVMPGTIQGAELARRAEASYPQMELLLISGYPQEAAIEGNGVATRHPVLTKPIPRTELLSHVDALLKSQAAPS